MTYAALRAVRPVIHCQTVSPQLSAVALVVLCVARHLYISQHLARFMERTDVKTRVAIGLADAAAVARDCRPNVVVCDYDLLATLSLGAWETDELLSRLPIIAVSMTRRPEEVNVLDVNGIAGFLYLPTLNAEVARQMLHAASRSVVRAPADTPLAWATELRTAPTLS